MLTVQEQMDFIIGPQVPIGNTWFDQTQIGMARMLGERCPTTPPTDPDALNSFLVNLHYYDLALSEYIVYRRTGDPVFLTYARKCADAWWQHPFFKEGRERNFEGAAKPSPKFAGLYGLMLRALDGRRELWDWIVAYTFYDADIWLMTRINNPALHYGVREGAFMLHFMTLLSQVLPDSYPLQSGGTATNGAEVRARMLANAERAATDYFGRLQLADGSWRWTDPDETDPDGGILKGITQPFMIGLLLTALIDLHLVTANPLVRDSHPKGWDIRNQILRSCRHLYTSGTYRKDDPTPYDPNKRWRCFWYLYHGGTAVNPTKFEGGGWSLAGRNADEISDARQGNGTVVPAFAYAYKISGDPFFREAFNELWDASYTGSDGIRNLMATDGKGFNQNCRRSGSGLVWAGGVSAPLPQPVPLPVEPLPPKPIEPPAPPVPVPIPTEPVRPTAKITSVANGDTLTGEVFVVAVASDNADSVYLLVDGHTAGTFIPAGGEYVCKLDTKKLPDGAHSMYARAWPKAGEAGDSLTISFTVKNAVQVPEPPVPPQPEPIPPTPIPEPPKPPACSISAPASVSIPRNGSGTITVTLNDLSGPTQVNVLGSDGQVTVSPLSRTTTGTSAVMQFGVRVKNKRQVRTITFQSPCGSAVVRVNVN